MMQQPSEDQPPGIVLEEYQAGYKLWDRVLRPAKVIVSTAVEEKNGADPADDDQPQDKNDPEQKPDQEQS